MDAIQEHLRNNPAYDPTTGVDDLGFKPTVHWQTPQELLDKQRQIAMVKGSAIAAARGRRGPRWPARPRYWAWLGAGTAGRLS